MTVLITGAKGGLGYATALALAVDPTRTILLAGRSLPDLASVRAFAQQLAGQRLPPTPKAGPTAAAAAALRPDRVAGLSAARPGGADE